MWLDNLKELKTIKKMTSKQIAEEAKLPERTVHRIFSGESKMPCADTLYRIAKVLGASLDDILADTKVFVASQSMSDLKTNLEELTAERDILLKEKEILSAEVDMLKSKENALTAEVDLLRLKLNHKEEIIAIHNYYNKGFKINRRKQ